VRSPRQSRPVTANDACWCSRAIVEDERSDSSTTLFFPTPFSFRDLWCGLIDGCCRYSMRPSAKLFAACALIFSGFHLDHVSVMTRNIVIETKTGRSAVEIQHFSRAGKLFKDG